MGVKGLWELVKPTGRRVPFATLAQLSVAVDTSIWLNNFIKAMRDRDGRSIPNAHILGLFYRICKLLFAQVRPVFVFDGATPELKRRTLARRQAQRKKAATHVQRAAKRLMINQLKQQALRLAARTVSDKTPLQLEASATRAAQAAEDRQRQRDRAKGATSRVGAGDTGDTGNMSTVQTEGGEMTTQSTSAVAGGTHGDAAHGGRTVISQPESSAPIDLTSSTSDEEQEEDLNRYNYLPGSQEDDHAKGRLGSLSIDLANDDDAGVIGRQRKPVHLTTAQTLAEHQRKQAQRRQAVEELKAKFFPAGTSDPGTHGGSSSATTGAEPGKAEPSAEFLQEALADIVTDSGVTDIQALQSLPSDIQYEQLLDLQEAKLLQRRDAALQIAENPRDFSSFQLKALMKGAAFNQEVRNAKKRMNDMNQYEGSSKMASEADREYVLYRRQTEPAAGGFLSQALDSNKTRSSFTQQRLTLVAGTQGAIARLEEEAGGVGGGGGFMPEEAEEVIDAIGGADLSPAGTRRRDKGKGKIVIPGEHHAGVQAEIIDEHDAGVSGGEKEEEGEEDDASWEGSGVVIPRAPPLPLSQASASQDSGVLLPPPPPPLLAAGAAASSGRTRSDSNRAGPSRSPIAPAPLSSAPPAPSVPSALSAGVEGGGFMPEEGSDEMDREPDFNSEEERETQSWLSGKEMKDSDQEEDEHILPGGGFDDEELPDMPSSDNEMQEDPAPPTSGHGGDLAQVSDSDSDVRLVPSSSCTPSRSGGAEGAATTGSKEPLNSVNEVLLANSQSQSQSRQLSQQSKAQSQSQSQSQPLSQSQPMRLSRDADHDAQHMSQLTKDAQNAALREDISTRQFTLENEAAALKADMRRRERQNETVNDETIQDALELIQLFGMPYIFAPTEAEAQCATLQSLKLVDGIISDDSDVFVFGGSRVFKNFFDNKKFVECYTLEDIQNALALDRDGLIRFALLTGSDYTDGIKGVGPVTALEILSDFPGPDGLRQFAEWVRADPVIQSQQWEEDLLSRRLDGSKTIRAKYTKKRETSFDISENFPSDHIIEAYRHPNVDRSQQQFKWGRPDLDGVRAFMQRKLGWSEAKTDAELLPAVRKHAARQRQHSMDSFVSRTVQPSARASAVPNPGAKSSRLKRAVEALQGGSVTMQLPVKVAKKRGKGKGKGKGKSKGKGNGKGKGKKAKSTGLDFVPQSVVEEL